MHKLESPHTLKFHDWYETRNNLWLILEYCTGADLESLLKQDGHLPEASVRMFGLDMLAALKYMHQQGMLHCDLRPRNFLVDEYGILKICDFKMTRKIPKATLGETPLEQRGTAQYMAPELFVPEGVHSFSSDFWALGCVLYELRRGAAPYGDASTPLPQLIESINNLDPIDRPLLAAEPSKEAKGHAPSSSDRGVTVTQTNNTAPGSSVPSMTAKLADLLLWLMEKRPVHRCSWSKVSVHPFWGPNSNPVPSGLPLEPAFDSLVKSMEHTHSLQMEAAALAEYGLHDASADRPAPDKTGPSAAFVKTASAGGPGIPHVSDSTPIRPSAKASMEQMTATKLAEGRPLGTNMEADAKESSSSSSIGTRLATHKADDKAAAASLAAAPSSKDGRDARERIGRIGGKETPDTPDETDKTVRDDRLTSSARQTVKPVPTAAGGAGAASALNTTVTTTALVSATSLQTLFESISQLGLTAEKLLLHSSDTQVKPIVGNKAIEAVERLPFRSASLPFPYLDTSDIAKLTAAELEAHLTLIYKALQKANAEAAKTSKDILLSERSQMLSYLCALAPSAEVANIVLNTNFLQLLLRLIRTPESKTTSGTAGTSGTLSRSGSASSSRLATNTASPAAVTLRVTAATVLATMLRYATFIQPPSAKNKDEHLLPSLVAILRDSQRMDAKLKKRAVAALGETLFYVSSQEGEGSTDKWNVPLAAFAVLVKCLKDDTDEIVRHYAAKTIENVLAHGCLEFRRRLATIEVASRLLELSQKGGNDALQATCGMALAHILFLVMTVTSSSASGDREAAGLGTPRAHASHRSASSPSSQSPSASDLSPGPGAGATFVSRVLSKSGLPAMLETLHDGQPKLQQAYLNVIAVLFVSGARMAAAHGNASTKATRSGQQEQSFEDSITTTNADSVLRSVRLFFLKAPTLVHSLLRLIEQGASSAVRAKAIILAQLLCEHQPSLLATLGERRLPSALVRLLEPLIVSQRISRDTAASAYPSSAALCFLKFIRGCCVSSARGLVAQLSSLSSATSFSTSSHAAARAEGRLTTPETSPIKGRRPSSGVRQSPTPSRQKTSSSPDPALVQDEGLDMTRLVSAADSLRSAMSFASQPLLRRLIVACGGDFASALAEALVSLPALRGTMAGDARDRARDSDALAEDEALGQVEQAALVALEAVAQIDLAESEGTLGAGFLVAITTQLVGAAAGLASHRDGDLRVVVAASLRRLVPACLRAVAASSSSSSNSSSSSSSSSSSTPPPPPLAICTSPPPFGSMSANTTFAPPGCTPPPTRPAAASSSCSPADSAPSAMRFMSICMLASGCAPGPPTAPTCTFASASMITAAWLVPDCGLVTEMSRLDPAP